MLHILFSRSDLVGLRKFINQTQLALGTIVQAYAPIKVFPNYDPARSRAGDLVIYQPKSLLQKANFKASFRDEKETPFIFGPTHPPSRCGFHCSPHPLNRPGIGFHRALLLLQTAANSSVDTKGFAKFVGNFPGYLDGINCYYLL